MTDTPEKPKRPPTLLVLWIAMTMFAFGANIGALVEKYLLQPTWQTIVPDEVMAKNIQTMPGATGKLLPQDIIVHILSYRDFAVQGAVAEDMAHLAPFKDFIAYSRPSPESGKPCEVFIPEGFSITVDPKDSASGNFDAPDNAGTIAHEFFHCQYGTWHK